MSPVDFIVIFVIAAIIGLVITFIVRQKKRGVVCIGCPDSGSCQKNKCSGNCASCGSCQHSNK